MVRVCVCVYVLVYVNSVIYYEHGDDGQFNRLHRENFSFTSLKKISTSPKTLSNSYKTKDKNIGENIYN